MLEMSQVEYGRHRGVSKQAINKLVKAGKIQLIVKPDGRRVIDAAQADRALGEVRERVIAQDEPDQQARTFAPPEGGGLTKAKTATEVYRARLAQLEYEEKVGRLMRADDVVRSMELCAEAIVREIDRLPARAEDLAAAFTQGQIPAMRAALKDLARDVRSTLERSMRVLGKGEEVADVEPEKVPAP